MDYKFNNDVPIYLQIVDIISSEISSGKLKSGDKLPSVREYSLMYKVNPNTICKALSILENEKLIYTERTNGKYVSNNANTLNEYKEELFESKINSFLEDLYKMGYSKEEIIKKIKESK